MTRRAGVGAACVVVAALVTLGAGSSGERVPAGQWMKSICTSLRDWTDGIAAAQEGVDPVNPDLRQRRRDLVTYLDTVTESTRTLLTEFEDAGVPDVPDGKPIAKAFRAGVREARKAFAAAAEDVGELRVRNAEKFEQGQNEVYEQIQAARENAAAPFTEAAEKYETEEIDAAYRAEPACTGSG